MYKPSEVLIIKAVCTPVLEYCVCDALSVSAVSNFALISDNFDSV